MTRANFGFLWTHRYWLLFLVTPALLLGSVYIVASESNFRQNILIYCSMVFLLELLIAYSLIKNRTGVREILFNESNLVIRPWLNPTVETTWQEVTSVELLSAKNSKNGYSVPEYKISTIGGGQYFLPVNFPELPEFLAIVKKNDLGSE